MKVALPPASVVVRPLTGVTRTAAVGGGGGGGADPLTAVTFLANSDVSTGAAPAVSFVAVAEIGLPAATAAASATLKAALPLASVVTLAEPR